MSTRANRKKAAQLGMPPGTASARLRKMVLFDLICRLELNICYQCGETIDGIDGLSIEHKVPWLDSGRPVDLFFDLDNIAFSHLRCNVAAGTGQRPFAGHGPTGYRNGCRCGTCRSGHAARARKYCHQI